MQRLPLSILRIVLVGVGAYAAYLLLDPWGLGWLVLPVAMLVLVVLYFVRWVRSRRFAREIAREEAWGRTMVDGAARPAAIAEVRREVAATKTVADKVRLTVLLSDLVDAEGNRKEAESLLSDLDLRTLPPIEGAVVRHALATLHFRGGNADGARAILTPRAPRCGDADLDRRLELLDAMADMELGEADRALDTAIRIRRAAGADEALALEARIVRAAALDARGERADAVAALIALGPHVVEALTTLGGPRIVGLAQEAQEAQEAQDNPESVSQTPA
jgi:hypothetical protein